MHLLCSDDTVLTPEQCLDDRLTCFGWFTRVPQGIGQLTGLRFLCLSGNQLTCLPEELNGLVNLERLEAMSNFITEIPLLTMKLQYLDLTHNRLAHAAKLPPSLIFLSISNNLLQSLNISNLRSLTNLDLSFNQLVSVRGLSNRLEWLSIEGNPLLMPKFEIKTQWMQQVCAAFFSKHRPNHRFYCALAPIELINSAIPKQEFDFRVRSDLTLSLY